MGLKHQKINIRGTAWGLLGCLAWGLLGDTEHELWLCLLFAILTHELGHIVLSKLCHVPVTGLSLDLFGARLQLDGMVSYGQEFFIALGGPLVNLLTAGVLYATLGEAVWQDGGWVSTFFVASMALAIFNLLPVGTMDGGRMLSAVLSCWWSPALADGVLKVTTGLFLAGLWLISGYALITGAGMLSLFVFSLCFMVRVLG